ncbi:Guanine nucleotide exchange factor lte1 [Mucor velutinosus]|uniref:Guanine nucleotide exchange factor lte1 n=1 Tax=Mucor velutinosus TaxID=708070 RepID=A0AAN7DGT2_9FUNG|nr:Guanine nucleotide exchange factor lte1 [Mucor velutinosus]
MPFKSFISVQLLEPTIYVEPISNSNLVIRGTININLSSTTIVKSISVRFDGKMKTKNYISSSASAGGFAQKRSIAHHCLVLYPVEEQTDTNCPLILKAGLTHYGFEMQVPSKLPETVDCSDVKVNYHVTAVMEYESNSFLRVGRSSTAQSCAKQDVCIVRLPSGNLFFGSNTCEFIDSRTHTSDWLEYQVLVDKKSIALGSELPITFRMMPVREEVSVEGVNVQILERRDVFRKSTRTSYAVQSLLTAATNETEIPKTALPELWEGTIRYSILVGKSLVHSTLANSDFDIKHTLLVSIVLSAPGGIAGRMRKRVTFQSKIDLLNEAVGKLGSLKVPTYDSPPPFDDSTFVYGEYDRKFTDPIAYSDIHNNEHN